MRLFKTIRFIALSAMIAACSGESADDGMDTGDSKADQISGADDPSGLLPDAERRFQKLFSAADIGQTFLVTDDAMPYPDTYWPMVDNGIAGNWLEKSGNQCELVNAPMEQGGGKVVHSCADPQPSPLVKFMSVTNPAELEDAVEWEIENHGKQVPGVQDWFGHCPGWVATGLLNAPIVRPVSVKLEGSNLAECTPGSTGCVTFEIGDINALGAEAHEGAQSRFIGARCDTDPTEIERDEFGRIVRNGAGCKGLNAGTMLIVLGNQIKIAKKPFAIDAQNEFTTNQIWNQPAIGYTVNRAFRLTTSQAANLVATGGKSLTGDLTEYVFNKNAKAFALVDFSLIWVTEFGPNTRVISGTDSTNQTRMFAVIELDGELTDPEANIIGGEYIDDESVGANRLRNAPFAWLAVSMADDDAHNPFVQGRLVQQLLDLGKKSGN